MFPPIVEIKAMDMVFRDGQPFNPTTRSPPMSDRRTWPPTANYGSSRCIVIFISVSYLYKATFAESMQAQFQELCNENAELKGAMRTTRKELQRVDHQLACLRPFKESMLRSHRHEYRKWGSAALYCWSDQTVHEPRRFIFGWHPRAVSTDIFE